MRKYEIMYIVNPSLNEEATKNVIALVNKIFADNGSKVLAVKELGLKELAYEIQGNRKGFYVWAEVEANTQAVNEFKRIVGYEEKILRDIIVLED
jgi:small subunit ribosomal protein S6